jgi:hypothetical protein
VKNQPWQLDSDQMKRSPFLRAQELPMHLFWNGNPDEHIPGSSPCFL